MAVPSVDVATYLANAGLGLTLGTNLFTGLESEETGVPANAVFVYGMPGGPADRNADVRIEHRYAMVHVRARRTTQQAADTISRQILDALQGADLGGDYLDLRALQSEPGTALSSQTGRHVVSLSFEAVYESDLR